MVSHPHASPTRPPRVNLDTLAIGAPLTAALVGVLLTEGQGAFGNAAAGPSAADGTAARPGDGEAGASWHHDVAVAQLGPAAQGGLTGQSAASTGGEIFDPVAANGAAALAGTIPSTAAGTLVPPGATPAGMDGQAPLSAGTSITLGTGAPLDGFGLDEGSADGASSTGRIGTTITGTAGDDVIHGTPHDDRLFGGAGNDIIHATRATICWTAAPVTISCSAAPETINSSAATAMTACLAALAKIDSWAAAATIGCPAKRDGTGWTAARATTCSMVVPTQTD